MHAPPGTAKGGVIARTSFACVGSLTASSARMRAVSPRLFGLSCFILLLACGDDPAPTATPGEVEDVPEVLTFDPKMVTGPSEDDDDPAPDDDPEPNERDSGAQRDAAANPSRMAAGQLRPSAARGCRPLAVS